jgi:hypothetical protein
VQEADALELQVRHPHVRMLALEPELEPAALAVTEVEVEHGHAVQLAICEQPLQVRESKLHAPVVARQPSPTDRFSHGLRRDATPSTFTAMGAWGVRAFDNDSVLDSVELLCDLDGCLIALDTLLRCDILDSWPNGADTIHVAYGACETIAAARTAKRYFQSVGTTLFSNRDEWQQVVAYVPDEIDAFLKTKPEFLDADVQLAIRVIDTIARIDSTEGWSDYDKRVEALMETRARLQAALDEKGI